MNLKKFSCYNTINDEITGRNVLLPCSTVYSWFKYEWIRDFDIEKLKDLTKKNDTCQKELTAKRKEFYNTNTSKERKIKNDELAKKVDKIGKEIKELEGVKKIAQAELDEYRNKFYDIEKEIHNCIQNRTKINPLMPLDIRDCVEEVTTALSEVLQNPKEKKGLIYFLAYQYYAYSLNSFMNQIIIKKEKISTPLREFLEASKVLNKYYSKTSSVETKLDNLYELVKDVIKDSHTRRKVVTTINDIKHTLRPYKDTSDEPEFNILYTVADINVAPVLSGFTVQPDSSDYLDSVKPFAVIVDGHAKLYQYYFFTVWSLFLSREGISHSKSALALKGLSRVRQYRRQPIVEDSLRGELMGKERKLFLGLFYWLLVSELNELYDVRSLLSLSNRKPLTYNKAGGKTGKQLLFTEHVNTQISRAQNIINRKKNDPFYGTMFNLVKGFDETMCQQGELEPNLDPFTPNLIHIYHLFPVLSYLNLKKEFNTSGSMYWQLCELFNKETFNPRPKEKKTAKNS